MTRELLAAAAAAADALRRFRIPETTPIPTRINVVKFRTDSQSNRKFRTIRRIKRKTKRP